MQQYHDLMNHILCHGTDKSDRTGTGTRSVFGHQMRFDLAKGFPLLTTKKVHLRSIVHELLWFLSGDTNIRYLKENGVSIWDEWADQDGNLGPVYGAQWRSWPSEYGDIDQIANLIQELKANPDSRRLIVSAWNPAQVDEMKLPPCHCLFQFYTAPMSLEERLDYLDETKPELVSHYNEFINYGHQKLAAIAEANAWLTEKGIPTRKLSCQLYQRSADVFLGVPFNIASYALLTHMIAQVTGMAVGEFVHTLGDAHLYLNHFEQAIAQLDRVEYDLPYLQLNPDVNNLFDFTFDDIKVVGYQHHPAIKAPVAV